MGHTVVWRFEAGQIIRSSRHIAEGPLRVLEVAGQMVRAETVERGPYGREIFWLEAGDCRPEVDPRL
jgi:hypothetical protein